MSTATYAPAAPAVAPNPQLSPYGLFGTQYPQSQYPQHQHQPGMFHPQQLQQLAQAQQLAQQAQQIAQAQQLAQQAQQIAQAQQLQQLQQAAQVHQLQQALAQQAVARQFQQNPFQHNPFQQAHLAPYGIVGDLVRAVAPIAAQQLIPNPQVAHDVNQILGSVASLLPFSAQSQQQLNPYGFAPGNGSPIGGQYSGNPYTGSPYAGNPIGGVMPFQAAPNPWMSAPTMPYPQPSMWN